MEKIIFFGLVIPIMGYVLYLGGMAIMNGFNAKEANRAEKDELEEETKKTISTDNNSLGDELAKLNWVKGHNKIEIIINNQLLKIPGEFNITSEMIDQMKSLNGVMKIDFVE